MEENYWTRRYTRRGIVRGIAAAAGAAALAPVIAACGGVTNKAAGTGLSAGKGIATVPATASAGAAISGAAVATAIATPVAVATANEAHASRGGPLNVGLFADFISFDTTQAQDVYSHDMIVQCCEALMMVTTDYKVKPLLAQSVELPDDHTYIFKLRQGITFHDGTDFNAAAVKTNLDRQIDDKSSVRHDDVKTITEVAAIDPATVRISLSAPFAPFLNKMADGAATIYSPAALQRLGSKLSSDLTGAGTGPFVFENWVKGSRATARANAGYWQKAIDGKPYPFVDRIIFQIIPDPAARLQALREGKIDIFDGNPPGKDVVNIQQSADLLFQQIPGLGFDFISLNVPKTPFDNKQVRQALSFAINRPEILQVVYSNLGVAWDMEIPSTIPGAIASPHPYKQQNIAKAKSLLREAAAAGGVPFTIEFSSSDPQLQLAIQTIMQQVSGAGFTLASLPKQFADVVADANKGTYQAAALEWTTGIDPDDYVYPLFQTNGGFNLSHYSNQSVDMLLERGRTTLDLQQRIPIYQQIQVILADDEPFIIYRVPPLTMTVRKQVFNYQLGPNAIGQLYKVWKTP